MKQILTTKILESHLVEGDLVPGSEISIKIDHTLLQDATGTMAMLEFIAMGLPRVNVGLAAQYVDHNLLQTDYKNADDHAGIIFPLEDGSEVDIKTGPNIVPFPDFEALPLFG